MGKQSHCQRFSSTVKTYLDHVKREFGFWSLHNVLQPLVLREQQIRDRMQQEVTNATMKRADLDTRT